MKVNLEKILIVVSIFFLLLSVGPATAFSAPGVSLPTDLEITPGGRIVVPVTIIGVAGEGIGSYALRLDYDTTMFSNPTVIAEGTLSDGNSNLQSLVPSDGIGDFSVGIGFGFTPAEDGTLIKVQFDVSEAFSGTSPISFAGKGVKTVLSTADFTLIETDFVDGSFTALDAQGPVISNLAVSLNDISEGTDIIVLTGTADDSTMGNGNIKRVEYFVGAPGTSGSGVAMNAEDGTFDSTGENFTATIDVSDWTAANSPYSFIVGAQDAQDNWGVTQTVEVSVYAIGSETVLTSIDTPSRNNMPVFEWSDVSGAAGYELEVSANADFSSPVIGQTNLPESGFASVEMLPDGTYYWRVRAVDGDEHAGDWVEGSFFVIDTVSPAPVTGLGATPKPNGDLELVWTNPWQDYAGVLILGNTGSAVAFTPAHGTAYRGGEQSGVVLAAIDGNRYTDMPDHGVIRHYVVYVFDAAYNYSAVAVAYATSSDTTAPSAVSGLFAAPGDTKATLTWSNADDTDAAGVLILYRQGAAPTGTPALDTVYAVNNAIGNGTVGFIGTASTVTIKGLTNDLTYYFKVFSYDERPNYAAATEASTTPVAFGIVKPELPENVQVGAVVEFEAAGSVSGNYQWTFSAGAPGTANTKSVSWTAPESVTTFPAEVIITVKDPDTAGLEAAGTINVFSPVVITNKPAETLTLKPGMTSMIYEAGGGDGASYTWTLTDQSGTVIDTRADAASYSFVAPAEGAFAGEYSVTVSDSEGFTDSFAVLVPLALDPQYFTMVEDDALDIEILGAAEDVVFTVEAFDADSQAVEFSQKDGVPTGYGQMSVDGNILHYLPDDVSEINSFTLMVTAEEEDPADTPLADKGLDTLTSGIYRVVPNENCGGMVVDQEGNPIAEAFIEVIAPEIADRQTTSDADGLFEFTLPATGANYQLMVSLDGYVSKSFCAAELAEDSTVVIIKGEPLYISGMVNQDAGYPEALVCLNIDGEVSDFCTTKNGVFSFEFEADPGAQDYFLTAVSSDAYGELTCTGPLSINGADIDLKPDATGLIRLNIEDDIDYQETNYIYGSDLLFEITAQDSAGEPVGEFPSGLVLTVPFNLEKVAPGAFESGAISIYHAEDSETLLTGEGTAVQAEDVLAVDYIGDGQTGQIVFRVYSLSVFGIGSGSDEDGGGGSSSCFIGSLAGNSGMQLPAVTLVLTGIALVVSRIIRMMRNI